MFKSWKVRMRLKKQKKQILDALHEDESKLCIYFTNNNEEKEHFLKTGKELEKFAKSVKTNKVKEKNTTTKETSLVLRSIKFDRKETLIAIKKLGEKENKNINCKIAVFQFEDLKPIHYQNLTEGVEIAKIITFYYTAGKGYLVKNHSDEIQVSPREKQRLLNVYVLIHSYPKVLLLDVQLSYLKEFAVKIINLIETDETLQERLRESVNIIGESNKVITISPHVEKDEPM